MTEQEQQEEMVTQITEMVEYLRDLLKSRPRDFVDFRLDEIAKQTEMEDSLKASISKALDDPEKPFKISFKPHVKD
jgi:hypothetical protein